MSEKILVPTLGESINEATVAKWLKNEGEAVAADEPIVELETDKVNLEGPSPVNGKLSKINSIDGTTVEVGAVLGIIGRFLFGDNRDKKDAANKLKEQQEALNKMTQNFSKIDTSKVPPPKSYTAIFFPPFLSKP